MRSLGKIMAHARRMAARHRAGGEITPGLFDVPGAPLPGSVAVCVAFTVFDEEYNENEQYKFAEIETATPTDDLTVRPEWQIKQGGLTGVATNLPESWLNDQVPEPEPPEPAGTFHTVPPDYPIVVWFHKPSGRYIFEAGPILPCNVCDQLHIETNLPSRLVCVFKDIEWAGSAGGDVDGITEADIQRLCRPEGYEVVQKGAGSFQYWPWGTGQPQPQDINVFVECRSLAGEWGWLDVWVLIRMDTWDYWSPAFWNKGFEDQWFVVTEEEVIESLVPAGGINGIKLPIPHYDYPRDQCGMNGTVEVKLLLGMSCLS